MASKFQKGIQELRDKLAVQSAETVARLKQIETDLRADIKATFHQLDEKIEAGFAMFEGCLTAQTRHTIESLEALLDQLIKLEQEHESRFAAQAASLADHEARLARLEQPGRPPAA